MALTKNFIVPTIFVVVNVALTFNSTTAQVDWKVCGKGISTLCGQIISSKVNLNEGPLPSDECCRQLVKIGKPCHDAFTQAHIQVNDFEGTVEGVTLRSNDEWAECESIAQLVPVLPPVYAPARTAPAEAPRHSRKWGWF